MYVFYHLFQQEDLVFLGKVVLALACNNIMAIQRDNISNSMELVARNYSADLKNFFVSVFVTSYFICSYVTFLLKLFLLFFCV